MPRYELNFLGNTSELIHNYLDGGTPPTDEQLLLQLVYGLCGKLNNSREEHCPVFSAVGIPLPFMRRLAKLLVEKLKLPIPVERVDEWIRWQQTNQCCIVNKEMIQEAKRLKTLDFSESQTLGENS